MIARGTGCDYVRTYGIPKKPERALAIDRRRARRGAIDVGRATYATHGRAAGSRMFLNIASCGMSGRRGRARERAHRSASAARRRSCGRRWRRSWAGGTSSSTSAPTTSSATLVANNVVVRELPLLRRRHEDRPRRAARRRAARRDPGRRRRRRSTSFSTCTGSTAARSAGTRRWRTLRARAGSRSRRCRRCPIEIDGEQPGTTPVTFEIVPQALRSDRSVRGASS